MTRNRLIGAIAALVGVVLVAAAPNYLSGVQRVEHIGVPVDTRNCVRADWTIATDGGYLAGPSDAMVVGDATVLVPTLPELNKSYICFSRNNGSCIRQGGQPASCAYAFPLPADQYSMPIAFMPEADGGRPIVLGIGNGGTASVECCPINPTVMQGR